MEEGVRGKLILKLKDYEKEELIALNACRERGDLRDMAIHLAHLSRLKRCINALSDHGGTRETGMSSLRNRPSRG